METGQVRVGAAAAASLAAAGIIGSFAAVGFAGGAGPAAGQQYGDNKVTICHHAGGKRATKHVTIRVSRSAVSAHQRHGDTLGACASKVNRLRHATKGHVNKFHKQAKAQGQAGKGKGKGKRGKG